MTTAPGPRQPGRFATRLLWALVGVGVALTVTWLVVVELAQVSPLATSLAVSLAVAAAASLVAAGTVAWIVSRRIARPLEQLAEAAEAVANGSYDVPVPSAQMSVELQRLSEAFRRMSSRLSDTEASRTRLLSDLAHEIRTPLATLEAYIDGLEDGVVSADATSWATMRDQVTRLRRLTADLRETAAAEEHALNLQLEVTDLAEIVVASVEAVVPRYRMKGVDVAASIGRRALPVRIDRDRLSQVLANLLDNALRHTAPGGQAVVELSGEGRSAVIRVIDTGEGIPADQLESVFARFHRVDSSRRAADGSGSGLGLTIARAIVSDHGGTITATSPSGQAADSASGTGAIGPGTVFTIRLPLITRSGPRLPGRTAGRSAGSGPSGDRPT
jgi:signal transduction histidine kinase